jgi:hypothetical protein
VQFVRSFRVLAVRGPACGAAAAARSAARKRRRARSRALAHACTQQPQRACARGGAHPSLCAAPSVLLARELPQRVSRDLVRALSFRARHPVAVRLRGSQLRLDARQLRRLRVELLRCLRAAKASGLWARPGPMRTHTGSERRKHARTRRHLLACSLKLAARAGAPGARTCWNCSAKAAMMFAITCDKFCAAACARCCSPRPRLAARSAARAAGSCAPAR